MWTGWNELIHPKMIGHYIYLIYYEDQELIQEVAKVVGTGYRGTEPVLLISEPDDETDISMIRKEGKGIYWDACEIGKGF